MPQTIPFSFLFFSKMKDYFIAVAFSKLSLKITLQSITFNHLVFTWSSGKFCYDFWKASFWFYPRKHCFYFG